MLRAALEDSGIVCAFSGGEMGAEEFERLFDADYGDLLDVGARVVTVERDFSTRRGFDRADGTVPEDRVEWAR